MGEEYNTLGEVRAGPGHNIQGGGGGDGEHNVYNYLQNEADPYSHIQRDKQPTQRVDGDQVHYSHVL
jgi:hypothetical protein